MSLKLMTGKRYTIICKNPPFIFDGRNLLDVPKLEEIGF